MTAETRLARVIDRLAVGTRVIGMREYDSVRAERNGNQRDRNLERAVDKLESAADSLWQAIEK